MVKPVLYSYWRSSCSWRIRAALAYKGIEYEYKPVNLLKSEQTSADYLSINPSGKVPSLVIDGHTLNESLVILEYLNETHTDAPALLPKDPFQRSQARRVCLEIAASIQPIQNLRLLKHIGDTFGAEHKAPWAKHFIAQGFQSLEKLLVETSGTHCVGDELSMADFCLVPQVYNAKRFSVDMSAYPTIDRLDKALLELDCFKASHPDVQPDTPETEKPDLTKGGY